MIRLINKFPYVEISKVLKPEDFETIIVNDEKITVEQTERLKAMKDLLTNNRIPLGKVRFVYSKSFEYDVDNDKVNPTYKIIRPKKQRKNVHEVMIGKPENLMSINCGIYDDFYFIREHIKRSKKGVVICVAQNNTSIKNAILMANLDNAVKHYNEGTKIL